MADPVTGAATPDRPLQATVLDVVLPVLDEEAVLDASVRALHRHLETMAVPFRITIVDNGSTDTTARIASALAGEFERVRALHTSQRGKGHAIALGWSTSDADVLAFMDVDLSVDLDDLTPLVAPLLTDSSSTDAADLCIGSRYLDGAEVTRGWRRTLISRGYRRLVRLCLGATVTDPPCGFKAIRRTTASELLPLVQDTAWFFDTELVVLAQRGGHRIREIPVTWHEGTDSRVAVVHVALADLAGIIRLRRRS